MDESVASDESLRALQYLLFLQMGSRISPHPDFPFSLAPNALGIFPQPFVRSQGCLCYSSILDSLNLQKFGKRNVDPVPFEREAFFPSTLTMNLDILCRERTPRSLERDTIFPTVDEKWGLEPADFR